MSSKNTATAKTVRLAAPVKINGADVEEVTVRRPKVGDLRRMDRVKGSEMDKTLWMVSTLTELSPEEVDELDAADLDAIGEVIAGFTGKAV